jgi:hypothetical protein
VLVLQHSHFEVNASEQAPQKFQSASSSFRPVKINEPPWPQECIKKILEDGPLNKTLVTAFADKWRRCNTLCKDFPDYFEFRLWLCMNEDDEGSYVSGAIGKNLST